MAMNVEAEIRELKRRVSEIEGSFGFLTQPIKGVHKDLLTFQARTEQNFEKINGRLDKHDDRFDRLDKEGRDLRKGMPGIDRGAMRELGPDRHGNSSKEPGGRRRRRRRSDHRPT